ncbi:hypothetical protein ASPWEDRAFT_47592 [Aspergillus wentii DTO 134E9]|uniref:Arf-GAP domain-containing protein n=1 Tax=Aspergillus wentii DTO 134E9 TaxID=1073089 RepID=A0A1L9S134_ASPWE|nr:uncharacterized protein ASPWEDRAFT_47592 [Aspergillus wentii DTO 134E9]KAI9931122.1 hypothetical protein MW887_010779 [Aspergillus wentii]OJJ40876.1 hypothetical protein ASPWEDRAFT_47592 [Aspergillus wentii DTO 134E9]
MVAGISKRQQFRNEKALQDLIRSVPGNDRCADCDALNPGWASWNMGIFLCMRCATLHRKLGTHISKVKSLSMDSWSSDQVDNMKSHGNNLMNKIFNPKNIKPPIPVDIDEADSCMERYIRQKYQHRSLEDGKPKPPSRHDSGYTRSPEGSPPPLPPKTGKFFGFGLRTASSTSNLRRQSVAKASSPRSERHDSPPPVPMNTASRGFGAAVGDMTGASFEGKLIALREMGFPDDRRNATVLRGLNGDLERAVESLTRLGEGGMPASRARTPVPAATTVTGGSDGAIKRDTSFNPFDQLDSKPPSQPTGSSYNPFDVPTQQPASAHPSSAHNLEASFQNLQVSQPLFPHSTGGYPTQQHSLPQPLYQQSATPPVTSTFSQSFVSSPQSFDAGNNPFFQQTQAQAGFNQPSNQNLGVPQTNPFFNQGSQNSMQQPQSQLSAVGSVPTIAAPNPPRHANTMPAFSSTSPFGPASPFQQQQQAQQAQQSHLQPPSTSPFGPVQQQQVQPQSTSPFGPVQPQLQPQSTSPFGPVKPQQPQLQPQSTSPFGPVQQQPQTTSPFAPVQQQQVQPQSTSPFGPIQPQQTQPFQQAQSAFPGQSPNNPFQSMTAPTTPQSAGFQTQFQSQLQPGFQQPQQLTPQATGRVDKSSILSLYGLSPAPSVPTQQPQTISPVPGLTPSIGSTPQSQAASTPQQPQPPSAGFAAAGSRNPYMSTSPGMPQPGFPAQPQPSQSGLGIGMGVKAPQPTTGPFSRSHMSQQSVDISGLQNGRHSPDAFASLSARYG